MPTFKHPCPTCGTYINRDVAACPSCARQDPFAPARCPSCRSPLEDATWIACPKCGKPVGAAAVAQANQVAGAAGGPTTEAPHASPAPGAIPGWGQTATPALPPVAPALPPVATGPSLMACTACHSPLAEGARFCRDCGTPVA